MKDTFKIIGLMLLGLAIALVIYPLLHETGHTFATRCIEVGVDIKSLSEMLGHASVNITLNTYVHSSLDLKRLQIEKLNAICGQ